MVATKRRGHKRNAVNKSRRTRLSRSFKSKIVTAEKILEFFKGAFEGLLGEGPVGQVVKIISALSDLVDGKDLKFELDGKRELCSDFTLSTLYKKNLKANIAVPEADCTKVTKEDVAILQSNCEELAKTEKNQEDAKSSDWTQTLLKWFIGDDPGRPGKAEKIRKSIKEDIKKNDDKINFLNSNIAFLVGSGALSACYKEKKVDVKSVCGFSNSFFETKMNDPEVKYSIFNKFWAAFNTMTYIQTCTKAGQISDILSAAFALSKDDTPQEKVLKVAVSFTTQLLKTVTTTIYSLGLIAFNIYKATTVEDLLLKFFYWGKAVGGLIKYVLNILVPGSVAITGRKRRYSLKSIRKMMADK